MRRHLDKLLLFTCTKKKITTIFIYINLLLGFFFFLFSCQKPCRLPQTHGIIVIFRNNITEANCCYYDNDRHYGRARASERASERGLVGACGRKRQYETPVMTGKEHRQPRAVFLLHAQACANQLPLFFFFRKKGNRN